MSTVYNCSDLQNEVKLDNLQRVYCWLKKCQGSKEMTGYNFTQANYVRISKELKVIQYMFVFNILTKLSMNKIKE